MLHSFSSKEVNSQTSLPPSQIKDERSFQSASGGAAGALGRQATALEALTL